MKNSLESRLSELEATMPHGYTLLDTEGREVLKSNLPPLRWMAQTIHVLQNGDREARMILLDQLNRAHKSDAGDLLWQIVLAANYPAGTESERKGVRLDD